MSVYGCTLGLCACTCGLYTHESNVGGVGLGASAVRMYREFVSTGTAGSRGGLVRIGPRPRRSADGGHDDRWLEVLRTNCLRGHKREG